ncbi:hypothetical protein D9619_008331 [Psilocybe cf. subviscida]|uniref:FAD-binding domain-containing protein n=1 Tax=Psilocybe cf. subviscida TaxID=2480587 RepID=A0A8H5BC75_9AGAR|nr:hypothetical protein D9619_008331 [Psilocybe cf. subviscida]
MVACSATEGTCLSYGDRYIAITMASTQSITAQSAITIDILIVGGGIGGLAAAFCLGRSGHRVTVIEQGALLDSSGAGIQLSPNASRLLIRWGLKASLDTMGVKPVSASFNRYVNDEQIGFNYIGDIYETEYGSPYYHIHRADLLTMLYHLAKRHASFQQGMVTKVLSESGCSKPSVLLDSGEQITADVIIGADGLKSVVRGCIVHGPDRAVPTGYMTYRATIPAEKMKSDKDLSSLFSKPEITCWMGPNRHIVGYFVREKALYNIVMVRPDTGAQESWTKSAPKEEVEESFRGWNRRVENLIGLVEDVKKLKLVVRPPLRTWIDNNGKIALLGDSCHAMLPYLAQGAAMAIEDAAVLGRLFSNLTDLSQITPLLKAYETIRLPRATATQKASHANQSRFHLPDGPLQRTRDAAMQAAMQETLQATSLRLTTNHSVVLGHDISLTALQFGYDAEAQADRWLSEEHSSMVRLFQYLAAAVIIRSCICTVNDIVDRDIDASVSRTKKRPLPSGRISVRSALIFLFLQYSLGIVFFVTFLEGLALWTALFQFIPMGVVYPFLKRYTHWPQAWLGFLMNFGLVTAWISTTGFVHSALLVSLLLSCWCWTLYYDTIYACQDAKDDIKLGVHSTAILFGSWIRPLLVAFGVSFVSLLAICGHSNNQGWIFYIVSVGGTIGHLLWQSFTVNLDVPRSCWRTFTRNGHLGWIIWAGLALDYLRIM